MECLADAEKGLTDNVIESLKLSSEKLRMYSSMIELLEQVADKPEDFDTIQTLTTNY